MPAVAFEEVQLLIMNIFGVYVEWWVHTHLILVFISGPGCVVRVHVRRVCVCARVQASVQMWCPCGNPIAIYYTGIKPRQIQYIMTTNTHLSVRNDMPH